MKNRDLPVLAKTLQIPAWISCNQRSKAEGTEALWTLLNPFAYPCRYSDMIPRFVRPVSVLNMVTNQVLDYIYAVRSRRIINWNPTVLNPPVCNPMPKLSPKWGHHCRAVLVLLTEQLGLLRDLIIIREFSTTVIKKRKLI